MTTATKQCPHSGGYELLCDRTDCDSCVIFIENQRKRKDNICPHCGCNLDVEREVFSKDKLFTGHSCKGKEKKNDNTK